MEELGSRRGAATGPLGRPGGRSGPAPRAAGRLPHPPRGRPGRHGRRLRGGAGVARPARGAEGAARGHGLTSPTDLERFRREAQAAAGCTTPTSCRSSASASTRASTTTPCSSSRARAGRGPRRAATAPPPRGADAAAAARPAPSGPAERPRSLVQAARVGRPSARRGARPQRPGRRHPDAPRRRRRPAEAATRAGRRAGRPAAAARLRPLPGDRSELSATESAAALLPQRGPGRRAGGRGAGLRPRPGDRSTATSSRRTCCSTPQGTVWVTDFGLAKADEDGRPDHTGDIVGTLRYMAPERFQGQSDAAERRLQPGPDALRAADAAAGLRRRPTGRELIERVHARGAAAAAPARPHDPPRPGDDRPEGDRQGPAGATRRPRSWPTTCGGSSTTGRSGRGRSRPGTSGLALVPAATEAALATVGVVAAVAMMGMAVSLWYGDRLARGHSTSNASPGRPRLARRQLRPARATARLLPRRLPRPLGMAVPEAADAIPSNSSSRAIAEASTAWPIVPTARGSPRSASMAM